MKTENKDWKRKLIFKNDTKWILYWEIVFTSTNYWKYSNIYILWANHQFFIASRWELKHLLIFGPTGPFQDLRLRNYLTQLFKWLESSMVTTHIQHNCRRPLFCRSRSPQRPSSCIWIGIETVGFSQRWFPEWVFEKISTNSCIVQYSHHTIEQV